MKIPRSRASITSRTGALTLAPPPRALLQSGDPYVRGGNILLDPGFEFHVDNTGGWLEDSTDPDRRPGGTSNYTLPTLDIACPAFKRWPNGICATRDLGSWVQGGGLSIGMVGAVE